jgi:hypothetical protein
MWSCKLRTSAPRSSAARATTQFVAAWAISYAVYRINGYDEIEVWAGSSLGGRRSDNAWPRQIVRNRGLTPRRT